MPLPANTFMATIDVTSLYTNTPNPMVSLPLNISLTNALPTPYPPLSSLTNLPKLSSVTNISPLTPNITFRLRELLWAPIWPLPMPTCSKVSFTPLSRNPASGCVLSMTFSYYILMVPTPPPSSLNVSTPAIPSYSIGTPPPPKSH